jgi:cytochrome P450
LNYLDSQHNFPSRLAPDLTIVEQLWGFIIAGHDTSSTTLLWGIKLLTKHAEEQTKLRAALHQAFPRALAEGRLPTADEIHDTVIPYLDAAQEEIIRHAGTVGGISRDAMQDTTVLSHFIPKGTTVVMSGVGPSVLTPPLAVDDAARSETSRQAMRQGRVRLWDPEDIGVFKPERWLAAAAAGERKKAAVDGVEFDASAGPLFTFGLGVRGCFGRRLAYVELRTMLALIVWRFVLEPTPEKLSSWFATDGLTHKPDQTYVRLRPAY